jgi:dTDP-4-dehydrorhamnose 3,5-epimerase
MIFSETPLPGAFLIDLEPHKDNRGFFARAWCQTELAQHGLEPQIAQCNISFNPTEGTLRGLHYQRQPHAEVKVVRCTRGAIWDVIVDVRPGSPTYRQWFGTELSADNRRMLYVPEDFAHGYVTLEPGSEAFYQVSREYAPGSEVGIRWNDPSIGIIWPEVKISVISEKDASFPDFVG